MWFHISKKFLGNKITLTPKVPDSAQLHIEGDIPRICVSSSIYKCLCGILGNGRLRSFEAKAEFAENPCVYFTEKTPYLPPDCIDFRKIDEHWFLYPTDFYFAARIDLYNLFANHYIVPTNTAKPRFPKKGAIVEGEPLYDFMPRVIKERFHG